MTPQEMVMAVSEGVKQGIAVLPVPIAVSSVSRNMKQRESPELEKAKLWLKQNPDMKGLSLRKAALDAGVHYSTLNRAKGEI